VKERKCEERNKNKPERGSDQYLCNKINIALSESNNSQNIECKIEGNAAQKITISSKAKERVSFV